MPDGLRPNNEDELRTAYENLLFDNLMPARWHLESCTHHRAVMGNWTHTCSLVNVEIWVLIKDKQESSDSFPVCWQGV